MERNTRWIDEYRNGVPLADAVIQFVPQTLQRAYRWACKRQAAYGAVSTLRTIQTLRLPLIPESAKDILAAGLVLDWRQPSASSLCDKSPTHYPRSERPPARYPEVYWREMGLVLANDIHSGKYLVLGFEAPRKSEDCPKRLPEDVLQSSPQIDLYASTVKGVGLQFIGVRLIPRPVTEFEDEPPTGTRSKKRIIQRIARPLIANGQLNRNLPRKKSQNWCAPLPASPTARRGLAWTQSQRT